jgi:hypothetical protein
MLLLRVEIILKELEAQSKFIQRCAYSNLNLYRELKVFTEGETKLYKLIYYIAILYLS